MQLIIKEFYKRFIVIESTIGLKKCFLIKDTKTISFVQTMYATYDSALKQAKHLNKIS